MQPIFIRCVQIVAAGLVSAGLPCSWVDVEIRCRLTRQLEVMVDLMRKDQFAAIWLKA